MMRSTRAQRAERVMAAQEDRASLGEISKPEETTGARRLAFDRSALVKFARMIQARSSFAPDRLAHEKSAPTNFAPKKVRSRQVGPFEIQVAQIEILERFSGQIRRVIGPRCVQHCADLIGSEIGGWTRRRRQHQQHTYELDRSVHAQFSSTTRAAEQNLRDPDPSKGALQTLISRR